MKKFHKDQSGAAMVLVIVSVALVSLLAIVILTITMSNLRMKIVDQKSKGNFYSAEEALDEIRAGLQEEVSVQMTRAYLNIVEDYGSWKALSENEADVLKKMRESFVSDYLVGMRKNLRRGTDDTHYDTAILKGYLVNASDAVLSSSADSNEYRLMTTTEGIILKDLKVTYTDNMAYTSVIRTDILIGIPDMEFTMADTIPSFMDFSLVANRSLNVSAGSRLTAAGNIYGGSEGISIGGSALVDVRQTNLVITDREIAMAPSSSYMGGTTTTAWLEGITLQNNADLNLGGRTYIKDDVTVEGRNTSLSLGTEYYGYGNASASAENSSAIVVNGRDTTLDMSALNVLMLAGNSFVTTSRSDAQLKPTDTRTGSSVSVKSDQLAYLVPDTCGDIQNNPMSASQFRSLSSDGEWKNKILDTSLDGVNRTLRDYGGDIIEYYTSVNGQAQVYLYVQFENVDRAARYFSEYYNEGNNGEEIRQFLNLFVSAIYSPENFTRLDVAGNYLAQDESGQAEVRQAGLTPDNGERAQEIAAYGQMFEAYTKILSSNYDDMSEEEKAANVFDNLMSVNSRGTYRLREYMDARNVSRGEPLILEGSDGVRALLVDNAGGASYTLSASGKGIIIITGDVTISSLDFQGLVLVGGQAVISEGAEVRLTGDSDSIAYALMISDEIKNGLDGSETLWRVMDFFNVSDWKFLNAGNSSDPENSNKKLGADELVTYQNWKKE